MMPNLELNKFKNYAKLNLDSHPEDKFGQTKSGFPLG
jgi:hypothetical protein